MELRDKVVVVTGGAQGLGLAMAKGLAEKGAKLALLDVNEEPLAAAAESLASTGVEVMTHRTNVAAEEEVTGAFEAIVSRFGQLNGLINNAGISIFTPVDADNYLEIWDKHLSVLLTAQVRMVRAALPALRRSDAARIVNIASTEGLGATPYGSPYTAAKTGVTGLTRSLAVELGPEGITVNCICPGPIKTGMTAAISDEHKTIFAKRRTALKRYGEPEEVAQITVSLCLPAASYLTGAVIPVDGGLMARNA